MSTVFLLPEWANNCSLSLEQVCTGHDPLRAGEPVRQSGQHKRLNTRCNERVHPPRLVEVRSPRCTITNLFPNTFCSASFYKASRLTNQQLPSEVPKWLLAVCMCPRGAVPFRRAFYLFQSSRKCGQIKPNISVIPAGRLKGET